MSPKQYAFFIVSRSTQKFNFIPLIEEITQFILSHVQLHGSLAFVFEFFHTCKVNRSKRIFVLDSMTMRWINISLLRTVSIFYNIRVTHPVVESGSEVKLQSSQKISSHWSVNLGWRLKVVTICDIFLKPLLFPNYCITYLGKSNFFTETMKVLGKRREPHYSKTVVDEHSFGCCQNRQTSMVRQKGTKVLKSLTIFA